MVSRFFESISRVPVGFWLGLFVVTAVSSKYLPNLLGFKVIGFLGGFDQMF